MSENMSASEVVKKICNLPVDFYGGSKSAVALISESGVEAHPDALTVARVIEYLKSRPGLVDQWLNWSANKRVSSGWYFARKGGRLVVGFHPEGESLTFEDPILACAEFVVREVGTIADSGHCSL